VEKRPKRGLTLEKRLKGVVLEREEKWQEEEEEEVNGSLLFR